MPHPSGAPYVAETLAAQKKRIEELEAQISALIAGSILPADAADEITVDGVKWVRVPAECRVSFVRSNND